ncbi:hypothetical protein F383_38364 [Gossypium arboreum]|uniref:Uncharacterized protein n=1 Tax=Gossypium arboreum TaxID=29729 RepID=A0A0B0MG36_GOSAR|nr:hypothetical protein F383_38364 [Gossypium arboreum]
MCDTQLCCTALCPLGYATIVSQARATAKAHGNVLWLFEQVSMYTLF